MAGPKALTDFLGKFTVVPFQTDCGFCIVATGQAVATWITSFWALPNKTFGTPSAKVAIAIGVSGGSGHGGDCSAKANSSYGAW